ncbi:zinc ribbon domain-containing protein [Patescibacteria group bacterium]|nr:MAG: zinc ribbon domain-containing protein [Patescibacteria group bacterium]
MLCTKCGKSNPDEGKFCQDCGTKLEKPKAKAQSINDIKKTESEKVKSLSSRKRRKKIIIISVIIAILVLVGGSIGGCALYKNIEARSFDNKIKNITKESLEEGKILAEKFEELDNIEDIGDLTDDTKELKDKLKEDAETVEDLKTKGGKQQAIKDKTNDYLGKYYDYLVEIEDLTEDYGKESESITTETTTTENETEEATGTEAEELQEKADNLKDSYNDLKDNSDGLIEGDFEEKISEMPTIIQALILGKTLSDEQKAQQEALEEAQREAEEQKALEERRAKNLASATTIMTNFENALKNNSVSGFYNNTTSEFQSSADGQAILTSIQGAGTGLQSYSIRSNSRIGNSKYRFVLRDTYQVGGSTSSETKTYEVVKSGTRWLVDNIL